MHLLRHAETLYTLGDYTLAYREFCRVLEMAGPMDERGLGRRAGFGIKMCLRRLDATASISSEKSKAVAKAASGAPSAPKRARDIDALVTQELLKAYAKGEPT